MNHRPHQGVSVRTPSSAMLVQMLFAMSAVGTGVVSALVTWMGPKRDATPPPTTTPPEPKADDE